MLTESRINQIIRESLKKVLEGSTCTQVHGELTPYKEKQPFSPGPNASYDEMKKTAAERLRKAKEARKAKNS